MITSFFYIDQMNQYNNFLTLSLDVVAAIHEQFFISHPRRNNVLDKQMKTKILVTGGAGYIGSHTCKLLAAHGYEPITIDNLVNGHKWAVKWGELITGDIQDPGDPPELVADATKIKKQLNWAPQFSDLETLVQSAWQWYVKCNP